MDIIEDIRKLDAYLANQNNHDSDSDSVHTDELGIFELPTLKVSCSDKPDIDTPSTPMVSCSDESGFDKRSTPPDSSSDEQDQDEVKDPYEADARETIENCSDINLRKAIILNRRKRKILINLFNTLTTHLKKSEQMYATKMHSVNPRRCGFKYRLGSPYFKNKVNYQCPPNADAVAMRNADQLPQLAPRKHSWRRVDQTKLVHVVYEEICKQRTAQIQQLIENLAKTSRDNQTDLKKLMDIFRNKTVIDALALHWEEETLEYIEEKIKSEASIMDPDTLSSATNNNNNKPNKRKLEFNTLENKCNRGSSGLKYKIIENKYTKLTPPSFNITIVDTSTKLAEQNTSVVNPKPSISYSSTIDINSDSKELNSTECDKNLKIIDLDELNSTECEKKPRIIDLDSDFPKEILSDNNELIALYEKRTLLRCIAQWSKENIDWYKISLEHFKDRHQDYECEALWSVYLNPSLSKKPWTTVQDELLKKMAEENNFQNWDLIAQRLNTRKSGYECCVHFYEKLSEKRNLDTWTPEEEEQLKQIVNLCRIGGYISWSKVAFYFQNRTRVQIYNRYRYVLMPAKKGQFSTAEDILLMTLTNIYGKNMTKIGTYFGNREIPQLRDRLKTMAGSIREWSQEDDVAIIQHVHKHGEKNWKLLAALGQKPTCFRHRFNYIKKWFKMNPEGKMEQMLHRNKDHHKIRLETRSQIIDPLVAQLTSAGKSHANNYEILNISYIENQLKKQPRNKVIRGRNPNPKINFDDLLIDYFKTTHNHKWSDITNDLDGTVQRIKSILSFLNVQFQIPSLEILQQHPKLDDYDVKILCKLRQLPFYNHKIRPSVIPPTLETLVGYRGLWLLIPRLRKQAKGKMEGLYEVQSFKRVQGYYFCEAQMYQYLVSLPKETKQEILKERQIFWQRFYVLFKWPCLLSVLPVIPGVAESEIKPAESVQIENTTQIRENEAELGKKRKTKRESVEFNVEKKPKVN